MEQKDLNFLMPCGRLARPSSASKSGLSSAIGTAFITALLGASDALANEKAEKVLTSSVVVTATREAQDKSQVSESVDVLDASEIEFVAPSHPAEVLNRSAGVHVNNLGGEGHMTSIRQPITTGAVYLFLEDGVPTRPTGLFNHNGLYEINVPQAERIEVIKGPGSALYGSDSIGGIINSITKPSPEEFSGSVSPELGTDGWKRGLFTVGAPINEDHAYRLDLNITDNDGYRDDSDYSRYAGTLRFDSFFGDYTSAKTIVSYSKVEQSGVSSLEEDDYRNNPETNFYKGDVARRDVDALRVSTEISYEPDNHSLWTFTPFYRDNQMKLMPSWMLTYDPNDRDYQFQSYGLLNKYRYKFNDNSLLVTGLDIDYTPSTYEEKRIRVVDEAANVLNFATDGLVIQNTQDAGRTNYDYDADQLSLSPYIHAEWQASDSIRFNAGLRYDYFNVDYSDNLDASVIDSQSGADRFTHLRPVSQELSWNNLSEKLGVVFSLNESHDIYVNYRESFRAPSTGRLFRAGSTQNSDQLKPVTTKSAEVGIRAEIDDGLGYEFALYHMRVQNDIVSFVDGFTRSYANAGRTEHQGAELNLHAQLNDEFAVNLAHSVTSQKYKDFAAITGFPPTQINYAGNEVGKAPEYTGSLAFEINPTELPKLQLEFELEYVGSYFTDETNDNEYGGHKLLNFRGRYELSEDLKLYWRALNLADRRYSTYTSNQVGDPDISYRPGLPRSVFVGFTLDF